MTDTTTLVPSLVTVDWIRRELADVVTIGLQSGHHSGPVPGQFHMLWAVGVGEVPISVSGIDAGRVEHTIRAAGPATTALTRLEAGDQLGVRGPFGRGWDLDGLVGHDLLIVAGGLGLAPLRPVVELAARGELNADDVRVVFGARQPSELLFAGQIAERWRGLETAVTVDAAQPGWTGHVGTVVPLLQSVLPRAGETIALVCGPEVMMKVVATELTKSGVAPERIQVSLERNMHCGTGHCGHCQIGSIFSCTDGPVVTWDRAQSALRVRER